MIGDNVVLWEEGSEEEDFSSTYTFNFGTEVEKIEETYDDKDWSYGFDFSLPSLSNYLTDPGVNSALNIMSMVDIIQDIAGIGFGVAVKTNELVAISGFMLFLDVYAIYLVALEDPLIMITFPSTHDIIPTLEELIFETIMALDFIYDGTILFIFLNLSLIFNDSVNVLWYAFLALTTFTFVIDIYQYYVF
jgi:hypothetical protein